MYLNLDISNTSTAVEVFDGKRKLTTKFNKNMIILSNMEKRHRIFIAINLPQDIKKELSSFYDKWQELPAKWTAKDNLHITLEFLGDLTDIEIGDACKIVKEVAKRHNSFTINLNKILYGPPNKMPPKMIWAEGEKSDELVDLKEDLQECLLEKVRFRPESRGFVTHITLARISEWEFRKFEPEERPEVNENVDLMFTVESIEVMESELKRGGPVYTILESHQLI
jgi:2'-5' RNA ligase